MPSRRGEVDPPFTVRSHVDLLDGVPYHGSQQGLKRWLCRKIQPSHIRVQSKYAFTLNGTWASEQRNLTIKPRLHPSSEPLVLDSYRKLRPLTSAFRMEVKAPILPLHLNPINLYLPQLIM
jgi:hypothetical protein